jgi:hypothetical protein
MRTQRGLSLILLSALFCAVGSGCCCKKGFVVRGDWSLEMNRLPFMSSNGPQYETTCDEYECDVPCSCTDGCTTGGCTSGCSCGAHTGMGAHGYDYGPGAGGHGHGGAGHGAHGGSGEPTLPPPPTPTPGQAARFHPVPTRPVFEPSPNDYAPAGGEWVPAAAGARSQRRT